MSLRHAWRTHALGPVLVVWCDDGVVRVELGEVEPPEDSTEAEGPLVDRVLAALDTGEGTDIPVVFDGTPFQQRVWTALRGIPVGQTRTYAELAASLQPPSVARAVGTACGANVLAGLVPCHRVLRGDGGLGGFRWGLERKRALLATEARGSLL